MKATNLYFIFCGVLTVWLVYAQYTGQILWGGAGSVRRYASGYQHK